MRIFDIRWFRGFLLTSIFALGIIGIVASGSSDDDDDDDVTLNFPTTIELPAGARTIDVGNAAITAQEAILFVSVVSLLGDIADFKTAAPPNIEAPPAFAHVIQQAIDKFYKRDPNTPSVATGVVENLSADFCAGPGGGSAIANFTETATSALANIVFTACDTGFGVINGNLSVDATFDASENYDIRIGGTLTVSDVGVPAVTFVFDFINNGNDLTGNFTADIFYSVDGAPGGGYLVTTQTIVTGTAFEIVSGELIVEGSGGTRLLIQVVAPNTADVYLDTGDGLFDELVDTIAIFI
jgi:hypothetical protein